jgi:hypothetical protein
MHPQLHRITRIQPIPQANERPITIELYWPVYLSSFSQLDKMQRFKSALYDRCGHHVNIDFITVQDRSFGYIITENYIYQIEWNTTKPYSEEKRAMEELEDFLATVLVVP